MGASPFRTVTPTFQRDAPLVRPYAASMTPPDLDDSTRSRILAEEEYRAQVRQELRQQNAIHPTLWTALTGSVLLAAGPFLPAFKAPLVGEINLVGAGNRDGVILIALAILSGILAPRTRTWLIFTGVLAVVVEVFIFVNTKSGLSTGEFSSYVEFGWGWLVMAIGALLILWSGFNAPSGNVSPDEDTRDTRVMKGLIGLIVLLLVVFGIKFF